MNDPIEELELELKDAIAAAPEWLPLGRIGQSAVAAVCSLEGSGRHATVTGNGGGWWFVVLPQSGLALNSNTGTDGTPYPTVEEALTAASDALTAPDLIKES